MDTSKSALTRRQLLALLGATAGARLSPAWAVELEGIAPQPYFASVNRALEALATLGSPVAKADAQRLAGLARANDASAVEAAEKILDGYTLARLSVNANGSAQVTLGGAQRVLVEQGWRMFLLRVSDLTQNRGALDVYSRVGVFATMVPGRMIPRADGMAQRAYLPDTLNKEPLIEDMWLLSQLYGTSQIVRAGTIMTVAPLSGFAVEYCVLQLFSRDRGQRSADLAFSALPRTDQGYPASAMKRIAFDALPSRDVMLRVRDTDGRGCVASLIIKDKREHIYPPQAMRLAPDMFFQQHIYRADGEAVRLPDGEYTVESKRGPEYLRGVQTVIIGDGQDRIEVQLQRWVDPAQWGWYSGDPHIHAGGCSHYQNPTQGVSPETMIRHVRGEGLSIGGVLTWGPSWYYQKQFFTGRAASPAATLEHPELQAANHATLKPQPTPTDGESLLRYDVEISGFPSSLSGHVSLLRLKEQDYPGTKLIEDWPSWNLPIAKWAKAQGALVGYTHCGAGMVGNSTDLPNYEIPPFDSVGTNEAIVDVTHGMTDFLSGCDTSPVGELNAWYHLLNCGFRLAMVGETDYPCVSGERPGVGRTYVRLAQRPVGDAGYDAWITGLQQGRLYCGDGRSHFLEFKVQGRRNGEEDLTLKRAGTVNVEALVAARLEPEPTPETEAIRAAPVRGWHLENARIGNTREVAVELLVNGVAVDKATLIADGTPRAIKFKTALARSSWVALRIMPSAHTHPVFIQVERKPVRASKRSAQWCRTCVDKLWEVKSRFMRESERPAAAEAFDHARRAYEAILQECEVD